MSKPDHHEGQAIVQASFSSRDARRADRIQAEIIKAARQSGIDTTSEGYDLSHRHLNFRMDTSKLSRFCDLIQVNCQRLRLDRDEVKVSAKFSI